MVRHINVQQLLIICGTMVWHSPVLKVLIHLFELTSSMVQHSMVSKILNKNVFMFKLSNISCQIKVITKLPNSEQSYKGKVKTHNYINRQNQSTTGKL
jgi:hypothetical protein